MSAKERAHQYLYGELRCRGKVIAENTYFFENPRHLPLPEVNISKSCRIVDKNGGELTLKSAHLAYVVKVAGLRQGLTLEDNYFHINPGEEKKVAVKGKDITMADLRKVKIKTLNLP